MTQQDDITQRELTAEHHLNELMRLTQPWPNATIPCATVRSHVEQALSQVRAPVADERAADTLAERFALALTPVAYTTKRGAVYRGKSTRVGSENLCTISQAVYEFRAALASAPVAGEAKNYPGDNVAERLDKMADDQPPGSQAQSDLYAAATIWRKHIAHRAAPQASECECSRKSKAVSDSEAQL